MGFKIGGTLGKLGGAAAGSLVGGAIMGPAGAAVGALKGGKVSTGKFGDALLGNRDEAGALGTGQFRTGTADINEGAFTSTAASDARRGEFANALSQNAGQQAPVVDPSQQAEWRNRQSALADQLMMQANGQGGPSLAEMQMQSGMNQSIANANAQAVSARGVNPAMALRISQNTAANAQQATAGQTAALRAQEQQAARDQYANVTNSARNSDIGMATSNQNAQLVNRQANDAQDRFLREGQMTMDERDRQAQMDLGKLRVQENMGIAGTNSTAYQNAASNRQGIIGGIGQGIAAMSDEKTKTNISEVDVDDRDEDDEDILDAITASTKAKPQGETNAQSAGKGIGQMIGMMSDKNTKTDVVPSNDKAKSFVDALTAYNYNYKEPEKYGEGRHKGVMAQDLEKSELGKTMVMDTPEGKMINFGKAGGAMLATAAMLNDRVDGLEAALAARKKKREA